jgi:S-(hydroxymethyl)glutathione dehydrogenase/alcohol dehydrogenase
MTSKAKAAVLVETDGPLQVEEIEVRSPGPGEVLVRNIASGICHSDESARAGIFPVQMPIVLGHEGAGVVEAVGPDVDEFRCGDRVIGLSAPSCGCCWNCMNALPVLCEDSPAGWGGSRARLAGRSLSALWGLGTFAECMTVSDRSIVKAETDLPFEQLALLGCAVTTGLGAVFNVGHVAPGQTVVVIGCGGVGQSIVQGARIAGAARIIAVDPSGSKRDAALRAGATNTVDPSAVDPIDAVLTLTRARRGVDVAFEAVGRGSTIFQAWRMTRGGGLTVPVGVGGSEVIGITAQELLFSGRRIQPSLNAEGFAKVEVPRFLRLAERGLLDLASMVSKRIALQEIEVGFGNLKNDEVLRTVIVYA